MDVRFFGTYDERRHPRVRVLRQGLAASSDVRRVQVDNVPVPITTAMRVDALRNPLRLLGFVPALLWAWLRLVARCLRGPRPDVVVVGHLGHLDVLLARLLFPRATLVLDYLISLQDTALDREVGHGGRLLWALALVDRVATRVADVVVVDTPENLATVPARSRPRAVVVPVGADRTWFDAGAVRAPHDDDLSVVFFGLYTPLQGAPVIGEALRLLHERGVTVRATMIGAGQDRAATEQACGDAPVTWLDWVEAEDLPTLVAGHDVCLGIFGTGPKAQRVAPNKVYQGAAAGCAVVTADTAPQRRALPPADFVAPGDSTALADALEKLSAGAEVDRLADAAHRYAGDHHHPAAVVAPLIATLTATLTATLNAPLTATLGDDADPTARTGHPMPTHDTGRLDPPLTPRAWLRHDLIAAGLADLPRDARLLEIGTGQGAMAVRLARRFDYTGIEADPDAARMARGRLAAAGLPHQLHRGRFEEVPLAPPYDAVCAFEVLEHIEDDAAALRTWIELLAPGGRVVLSVPAWQDKFGPWDEQVGHYRRYSPTELAARLTEAGFTTPRVHTYGFPLANVLEAVRNRLATTAGAEVDDEGDADMQDRTAASGRLYQPSSRAAALATDLATRPFRLVQRHVRNDRLATGIVAVARRPS